MNTLSLQHTTMPVTKSPLCREHTQMSAQIVTRPYCLLIRGDAPLCGAVCEPVGVDQAKAIAHAVHNHLTQEEILAGDETILVHNGLYQFFSLLDNGFRLLPEIHSEVTKRITPSHRFANATSIVGLSSEALDVVVHTTHRSLAPEDPRAPYYVLPVYILGGQPNDHTSYIPSTPALEARVAQILNADRTELAVLGIFSQESFRAWAGGPYEAVIGDIVRTVWHSQQPQLFMAGPVSVYLYRDVVSLPDFNEEQWALLNMGEGYLYSQYQEARDACAKVAHRAGVRVNIYSGAGWYAYAGENRTVTRERFA
jgi:hypothetical protein